MNGSVQRGSSYLQPAFLVCAAVLALAGGGMSVAVRKLGLCLEKEPLPLKKPLDRLDEASLAPYRVVARERIENNEIRKALGTDEYIHWVLEDPEQPTEGPVRRLALFVTYYPAPDRVPHVPEECYVGSGHLRLKTADIRFLIGQGSETRSVPGRYLVFGRSPGAGFLTAAEFPVLYFFRVNGEYEGHRDGARLALNRNIFGKHSYFCKIELAFNQALTAPTQAEAIAASNRLLSVVLPVLERQHWPDDVAE